MDSISEVDFRPNLNLATKEGALTEQQKSIKELAGYLDNGSKFAEELCKLPPGVQYSVVRTIAQSDRFIHPDGRLDTDFGVLSTPYTVKFTGSRYYESNPNPMHRIAYEQVKNGITLNGQNLNSLPGGFYQELPAGYSEQFIRANFIGKEDSPIKIDPFLLVALNLNKIRASQSFKVSDGLYQSLYNPKVTEGERLKKITSMSENFASDTEIAERLENMARRKGYVFDYQAPRIFEIITQGFNVKDTWQKRMR